MVNKAEVEVFAEDALRRLAAIEDRVEGRSAFDILGTELIDYEKTVFATGNFGKWRPLAAATIARKGSSQILVDTGALRGDLTKVAEVRGDSVGLYTRLSYANSLKKGRYNKATGRRMPGRHPTPTPPRRIRAIWERIIVRYFVDG